MATQALYRKWRSQTFGEVIGQDHATQTLQNAIETGRLGHAYLFTGPRGTGKTSTARILAKAVNCVGPPPKPCNACAICQTITAGRFMDLIEVDAASNTSVDDIRDLRDKVDFRPSEGQIKFYIIDEVHMLSKSAFNALLKTLEEPPPHVVFVLATTEPEKIPPTITSRCQRFDFKRIQLTDVVARLQYIIQQEGLAAEEAALTYIARQGGGSMRDSVSLLDQLTAYGDTIITLKLVHSVLGAVSASSITQLIEHLIQGNVADGLGLINEVINEGVEPRHFTLEVLEYLRGLLLVKYGQNEHMLNLPTDTIASMRPLAEQISTFKLLEAIKRLNQAVKHFKSGAGEAIVPQLPLELAFVEIATAGEKIHEEMASERQTPVARPTYTQAVPQRELVAPSPLQPMPLPPVESAPKTPITTLTKVDLRKYWRTIIAAVGKPFGIYLTQEYIEDVDIEGHVIHIYFKPESQLQEGRVNKSENKIIIQKAFHQVLGNTWQVEFSKKPKNASANTNTGSNKVVAAVSHPKTSLEDDELIQAALRLGGSIKKSYPKKIHES